MDLNFEIVVRLFFLILAESLWNSKIIMSISLKVYVYLLIDFSHYFATYIALAKETDFDPMGNQTHNPWVKSGTYCYWYLEEVYTTKWKSRFLAPAWQIEYN